MFKHILRELILVVSIIIGLYDYSSAMDGRNISEETKAIYDLANDWSDSNNPNGPWSYNGAPNSPIVVYQNDWLGQPGWAYAPQPLPGHVPFWFKVTNPVFENTFDIPIGRVGMHGSTDINAPAGVTWTSPISGHVKISGGVWTNPPKDRGMIWNIYFNGTRITGGDLYKFNPYTSDSPFKYEEGFGGAESLVLLVKVGDIINLEINRVPSNPSCFVGVDLTISEFLSPDINTPPIMNPIGNKTGREGQLIEFQVTATDPDPNDELTFSGDNLPPGATFDPVTAIFSWTPTYEQGGNYENIEFTVMDNGNPIELDTELITITIGDVNRPPVFTPIGSQAVDEGSLLEFTVVANDPDENNVTLNAINAPNGASFDSVTGLFSWTPDYLQEGTYTVTFTATDDGDPIESSEIGVPITVGNTANPTQLTDDLIDDIETSGVPNNVINSYLANLKKVNAFIEKGKIKPAANQIFAFMCKVEEDLAQDEIDQVMGDNYLFRATEIVEDLGVDPASRVCE